MIETFKPEEEFDFNKAIKEMCVIMFVAAFIICSGMFIISRIPTAYSDTKPVATQNIAIDRKLTVFPKPTRTIGLDKLSVYAYLAINHVYERKIVLRQTILETGWYTSKNCQDRNNVFGMKGGKQTKTNPNGYKIYPSWKHSVQAYKSWQDRNYNPEYCGSYYDFLEHVGYATSTEYTDKLKMIKFDR